MKQAVITLILTSLLVMSSVAAEPPVNASQNEAPGEQLIPETLLKKVSEGNGEVAYFIGNMFKDGLQNSYQSIPQDQALAKEWYLKSAELGYVHGMYETGLMLYHDKQWAAAKKWLQKAADEGLGEAFYRLAYYWVYGLAGESADCHMAYSWFEKAKIRAVKSAYNDWAWMLSTHHKEDCRNGHQALRIMSELEAEYGMQRMPWAMIDTKAAVLAEIADYNGAIELQSWVVAGYCKVTVSEIDDFSQLIATYETRTDEEKEPGCDGYVTRLQTYSQRQAWREVMEIDDDK